MIIVNVRVPAVEKVYNFSLDERARVADLIEEIVELVTQKEGLPFHGDYGDLVLCAAEKRLQCGDDSCLADYGICGGEELILV